MIHTILEDVADNLFNTDPYYQQGGDMVRVGGMGYSIDVIETARQPHHRHDRAEDRRGRWTRPRPMSSPAGPAVNEDTEGPAIWDVVEAYIRRKGTITLDPNTSVNVTGI